MNILPENMKMPEMSGPNLASGAASSHDFGENDKISSLALESIEGAIKDNLSKRSLSRIGIGNARQGVSHALQRAGKGVFARQEIVFELGSKAYTETTRQKWLDFTARLSGADSQRLQEKLKIFVEMGLGECFINEIFPRFAAEGDSKEILDSMNKMTSDPSFLWAAQKMELLSELTNLETQWQYPSFVAKKSHLFKESLAALGMISLNPDRDAQFYEHYKNAAPANRQILLHYAQRVERYSENSLASLRNSNRFSELQPKADCYSEMLLSRHEMMRRLMELVPQHDEVRLMMDDAHSNVTFERYTKGLQEGAVYLNTQDMLVSGSEEYQSYEVWQSGAHPVFIEPYGPMTDYFRSRGLNEIRRSIVETGYSPVTLQREFEARDYFTLASFLPGSNVDRSNKIHWPSRLLEYDQVYSHTIQKILKNEQTRYGLKFEDLPLPLQTFCTEFQVNFPGLPPASITKIDRGIEVVFDIPLRQHAARMSFLLDESTDGKTIVVNVHAMAGDEGDRWRRFAVVASLMAHLLKLDFFNGEAPRINYNHVDEVSFSLKVPAEYADLALFMNKLRVLIYENTMIADAAEDGTPRSSPERFEEVVIRGGEKRGYRDARVRQFGDLFHLTGLDDWKRVPGQFYRDSFYLNLYLLDYFTGKTDMEMVKRIVHNSLVGLSQYQLQDYSGVGITQAAERYYSAYSIVKTASLFEGIKASLSYLSGLNLSKDDRDKLERLISFVNQFENNRLYFED